jgi:ABC-type sugar transport system permease subunit
MAGKQFSPFMEMVVQPRFTVRAIVSYCLWKWLANSPPIYRTVLGTVLEQFSGKQSSPFMELFGQLCLTVWATVSYCLCNPVLQFVQLCLTACGNG